ncbi:zinc ribbon domain-containing protein [Isosphaeraceae bacterium EP7]
MGRRLGSAAVGRKKLQEPPAVHCRDCGGPLEIHQPSVDHPERLLGTCADCGDWYQAVPTAVGFSLTLIPVPEFNPSSYAAEPKRRLPLDERA